MIYALMTEQHIRDVLLKQYGLRVAPETLQYVIEALQNSPTGAPIVVIGADARTGVALRERVDADALRNAASES